MTPQTVTVEIFGDRYILKGDGDPEYVRRLAAIVDRKIREASGHLPGTPLAKLAILAAINLAHDNAKLTDDGSKKDHAIAHASKRTKDLIDSIEEQFDDLDLSL
ncbi:MAG: cell division protein ZapA [Nitrospirota bacterium]